MLFFFFFLLEMVIIKRNYFVILGFWVICGIDFFFVGVIIFWGIYLIIVFKL